MIKEYLDKKIDGKFDAIRDSVNYINEALIDIYSSIDTIRYLSYIKDNIDTKISQTKKL